MDKVNVAEKFALFDEKEDELFLVMKGRLNILLRDRQVSLGEGEFFVVPAGLEHKPVAPEEAHVILLEPASTLNTGDVRDERTQAHLDWISGGRMVPMRIRLATVTAHQSGVAP